MKLVHFEKHTLHKNFLRISCTKFPADLVTFTEEILNGKLHFLCIVKKRRSQKIFVRKLLVRLILQQSGVDRTMILDKVSYKFLING